MNIVDTGITFRVSLDPVARAFDDDEMRNFCC